MRVVPKICGVLHPVTGLRCGLYRPHRGPHRVLKADYPYNETVRHQSQSEREFVRVRVRGSGETP